MNTCTTAPETLQYSLNTPEEKLSAKPNQFTNKNVQQDHHQQQQILPFSYNNGFSAAQNFQDSAANVDEDFDGLIAQAMKLEPGLQTCCDEDFGGGGGGDFWGYGNILSGLDDMNGSISRTLSCPQPPVSVSVSAANIVGKDKQSSSFKKRKTLNLKDAKEDDKKQKGYTTTKDGNKETSDLSKDKSKTSEVQKTDYIHVRARRGQATDSHSLAERVRREKISERMKYLQNLVPGCNSISGKAGMLDEIINYVQSLQKQVEFLSMKLAVVTPGPDFSDDNYYTKEVFPLSSCQFQHLIDEVVPEICLPPNYQSSDALQQAVSSRGFGIGVDPHMALRRTISAPVSIPGTVFESPCLSYLQSWDADQQGIFGLECQQARSSLPYQLRTGYSAGGHVRMEM